MGLFKVSGLEYLRSSQAPGRAQAKAWRLAHEGQGGTPREQRPGLQLALPCPTSPLASVSPAAQWPGTVPPWASHSAEPRLGE